MVYGIKCFQCGKWLRDRFGVDLEEIHLVTNERGSLWCLCGECLQNIDYSGIATDGGIIISVTPDDEGEGEPGISPDDYRKENKNECSK